MEHFLCIPILIRCFFWNINLVWTDNKCTFLKRDIKSSQNYTMVLSLADLNYQLKSVFCIVNRTLSFMGRCYLGLFLTRLTLLLKSVKLWKDLTMLVGASQVPLYSFLLKISRVTSCIFNPFWDMVYHLERCGFKVVAATADGASPNRLDSLQRKVPV